MKRLVKIPFWDIGIFIIAYTVWQGEALAFDMDFSGRLSGWTTESRISGTWDTVSGLRYIPRLILRYPFGSDTFLDAEFSLNSFWVCDSSDRGDDYDIKRYRGNIRFATSQTETRIGLQKINFGPARLLRPLRWFDRVDPTDPQQLTDGVYALRFKYNTLENAGLWTWIIYGNENPKGYETLPTTTNSPEFGGRLEYPVLGGELAATVHSRRVDVSKINIPDFAENRFALDGHWDIGIGLSFESVFQQQKIESILPQSGATAFPYDWTKMTVIGTDYTFAWGNGLYALFENMAIVFSNHPFEWGEDILSSAYSLNYPIGIMDSLTAIGYYLWEEKTYYQHLSWQRTYDTLSLTISLFYYPDAMDVNRAFNQGMGGGGFGGQLFIIFNH